MLCCHIPQLLGFPQLLAFWGIASARSYSLPRWFLPNDRSMKVIKWLKKPDSQRFFHPQNFPRNNEGVKTAQQLNSPQLWLASLPPFKVTKQCWSQEYCFKCLLHGTSPSLLSRESNPRCPSSQRRPMPIGLCIRPGFTKIYIYISCF